MQQYITELSKYAIAGAMAVYTLGILVGIWLDDRKQRRLYIWQCLLMFLIQGMCFADLAIVSGQVEYVVFYVFVQIFLVVVSVIVPLIYEEVNRMLLSGMSMLTGMGLCMISRLGFGKAVRQYIIALISLMIALVIPYLFSRVRFLKKLKWVYGGVGLAMLAVVLILGELTYGSKLSFTFSFEIAQLTFQPSEFVKILYLFFLAGILWDNVSFARLAVSALFAGLHVVILVLSRDLGSALIFFVAYVFVAFVATGNYLCLPAGALGGCAASFLAYRGFAHVRTRVLAWRDPWSYIDAQGYAITQSLFAIGSGSWLGMGLMQGNPDDIPYVMEDFIFSSVCEELGVLFGICVILVSVGMFLAMMRIAVRIGDRFYRLIVYGVGIMYLFQIFLTVGGGVKFIPLTGVTLPFLSYGGSSVMVSTIMFFIVQGIYIRMKQEGGRRVAKRRVAEKRDAEESGGSRKKAAPKAEEAKS